MIVNNLEYIKEVFNQLIGGEKVLQTEINIALKKLDNIIDLNELNWQREKDKVEYTLDNNIAFDNYNKVSIKETESNIEHLYNYGLINEEDYIIISMILTNANRLDKILREKYVSKLDKEYNLFKKKPKRLNNK